MKICIHKKKYWGGYGKHKMFICPKCEKFNIGGRWVDTDNPIMYIMERQKKKKATYPIHLKIDEVCHSFKEVERTEHHCPGCGHYSGNGGGHLGDSAW
jgi:NMD protein affecting ribosome stability and mRNA decay